MSLGSKDSLRKYQLDSSPDEYVQVNEKDAHEAQMGEDSAMEYDQEKIFRHLYASFYI